MAPRSPHCHVPSFEDAHRRIAAQTFPVPSEERSGERLLQPFEVVSPLYKPRVFGRAHGTQSCQVPHHPAVVDQQLAPRRLQAVDLGNSHDVDHGFHCPKLSQHMPPDPDRLLAQKN